MSSTELDVVQVFQKYVAENPNNAVAVAAMQALTLVVKHSTSTTLMELRLELKAAADLLKSCKEKSISLTASSELFLRYVTCTTLDIPEFDKCKQRVIERGEYFVKNSMTSRNHISNLLNRFISDGKVSVHRHFTSVV